MTEIVRLLTRHRELFAASDELDLCVAREHLHNALQVLERTLQSIDGNATEPLSTKNFPQI